MFRAAVPSNEPAVTESTFSPLTHTRQQLDAILGTRAGSLVETPYPILLLALAMREKSAVLLLRRNQLEKEIVFDGGSPVDCRSNIATETLGRFLVSAGKLSEHDCHAALAASASRGVPLEEILSERKLIPPTELYRMLQQSLGRKLLEPFSWKSGSYDISYDVAPVESALRVRVPQLLVTGIVKVETQDSADEAVAFVSGKYLAISPDPLFGLEDVRLTQEQQKVLEAARRGTPFAEIHSTSGVAADDVNRIAYALLLLGVVMVTERPVRAMPPPVELEHPFRARPPAAVPSAVVPPVPAPPQHRAIEPQKPAVAPATAEEVMASYLAYRRKDAFELLEVAETDGLLHFNRAFLRMSDKFLPSRFDERAPDGLRDKAQDVFLAAARAYAELSDPERREALMKKRAWKREQAVAASAAPAGAAAKPAAARPLRKAELIDPEALCKNGRELAAAGKLREALSSFEMAAECDAQNGTYAAEAAWCRFQLLISPAPTALKMLKNAIRIDPRSGLAHLYAGRVQAALGNRLEAQAYLNRAGTLMPDDPRVAEALKNLR